MAVARADRAATHRLLPGRSDHVPPRRAPGRRVCHPRRARAPGRRGGSDPPVGGRPTACVVRRERRAASPRAIPSCRGRGRPLRPGPFRVRARDRVAGAHGQHVRLEPPDALRLPAAAAPLDPTLVPAVRPGRSPLSPRHDGVARMGPGSFRPPAGAYEPARHATVLRARSPRGIRLRAQGLCQRPRGRRVRAPLGGGRLVDAGARGRQQRFRLRLPPGPPLGGSIVRMVTWRGPVFRGRGGVRRARRLFRRLEPRRRGVAVTRPPPLGAPGPARLFRGGGALARPVGDRRARRARRPPPDPLRARPGAK